MISVAANRYARALASVVLEPGSGLDPQRVTERLRSMEQLMSESRDLRHVMLSPAVPGSRKRAVVALLTAEEGYPPKVRNFFYVLIDHRRIGQLPEIREGFQAAVDEATGFVKADVSSAQPLSDAQRVKLGTELGKVTGRQVRMECSVDPALVGGVVARVGSTIYDGSVRGQLDALRRRLATES